MQIVLNSLFHDVPRATVIWLALILLAALAIAGLIARAGRERRDDTVAILKTDLTRTVLAKQAQELRRYADEVAVAAGRAATMARRRREEWLAVQDDAATAWQAYDAADTVARRMSAAGALPLPRTPRTPGEYAERERYLHRAAMAACSRNELSVLELSDALAHRKGWDPRRHPIEQETVLRRAVRDGLLAKHRAAAKREQDTWEAAQAAATAAKSLKDEALAAAERARWVQRWLEPAAAPTTPAAGVIQRLQASAHWFTVRAGRA